MKKIFFYAALAVALTASCQKAQKNSVEVDPLDDGAPVPVTLGTNVVSATVKSSGALADFTSTTELDIFAIDKTCTGALNANSSYLLFNAEIDPSHGTSNINTGVYYEGTKNYVFYGYYVDDIAHNGDFEGDGSYLSTNPLKVSADAITLDVTIDGQQDILLAETNETNDITAASAAGINSSRVYSAYSARRGVKPNLVFEHQLSKLSFVLKTGYTIPDNNEVSVESLGVASLLNGTLTIVGASRGLQVSGDYPTADGIQNAIDGGGFNYLTLTESPALPILKTKDAETALTKNSIMVYPGAHDYYAQLKLTQVNNAVTPSTSTTVTSDFTIPQPTSGFEAGKEYKVTVVVYGLQAVVVDVTLKDWTPGGGVIIDSDDDDDPSWVL